ncbi:MAG: DNA polymerase III subunit alpha [Holosporales bacterium]
MRSVNSSIPFVHLRVHSAYSLAEGAIKVKDLVKLCHKRHMPAVALTDTNNLFGAVEFSMAAASAGIQPILGCTLKITPPKGDPRLRDNRLSMASSPRPLDTLVLLAKSQRGYQNLLKLVSAMYVQQLEGAELHVPFEALQQWGDDLIALSGGRDGAVGHHLLQGQRAAAEAALKAYLDVFGDRYYLEVSRLGIPQERRLEAQVLDLADTFGVPLVATNEAFFADEDMYAAHDALLCIASGRYVVEEDRRRVSPNNRLRSVEEMQRLFADLPEALHNTVVIAQRCAYMLTPQKPMLPSFPCEHGEDHELRAQATVGLEARLQHVLTPDMTQEEVAKTRETYVQRLERELDVITRMGYSGYYLIVADFIKWAKAQTIPVGPGRGSGAGSLVAWALTITDIDPIRLGLLFERFLNPERVSMPDFDVDFCQDRRDEVIAYVSQRYGADRVAQIITFGKLQARAVLRDVGRVLGMPYGQVDRLCKMVPNNPANPVTLEQALEQDPMLRQEQQNDPTVAKLLDMGMKLEGLYRHASTHAAGVVIGSKPLDELVPLYHDGKSALPATQFNMKDVETAGLVKFDFLGLKTLTIIQRTIDMLADRGIKIDISTIPLDDQKTFEMLQRVETMGVFQLESAGMRDVVRRLQPDRFEEVIALVALYRPGPMDDIPRYLACKHGHEAVTYAHPMLEEILKETFGVMVYQEQVMQIAQVMGGYTLGGADLLRRAMGKKIKSEMDAQQELFVNGAVKNGVDKAVASQIFESMAKFAGYGFNKCHSAPYALIAYQTAYLKANYPVEFLAATMTYDMSSTDKLNLFRQELQRLQIKLLPPDVNKSFSEFRVEQDEDGALCVRYALAAIKNVGAAAIDQMVAEREKNGPFTDIIDFARRLDSRVVNRRLLENLIAAGAFDTLNSNRAQLSASLDLVLRFVGEAIAESANNQVNLFGGAETPVTQVKLPDVDSWRHLEALQREFDAVGFYLSSHPLDAYGSSLEKLHLHPSTVLQTHFRRHEGSVLAVAGVVIAKKERLSKAGNRFAFVTLSDAAGVFEVTVFSEAYNRNRERIEAGATLFMRVAGRVEDENLRLTVQELAPLDDVLAAAPSILDLEVVSQDAFDKIRMLLSAAPKGKHVIQVSLLPQNGRKVSLALPGRYVIGVEMREMMARIPGVVNVRELQ